MIRKIHLGDEDVKIYDVYTFPLDTMRVDMQRKGNNSRSKYKYRLEFGTFDIETTSHINSITDGVLDGYGYMYIWQFCSANTVCVGRTWEEFILHLQKINSYFGSSGTDAVYVIFVHNLSFEFAWLSTELTRAGYTFDVFATKNRKVLTMRLKEINIEFRCSYKMSGRSLEKFLKDNPDCGLAKMVGSLDYRVERTPLTNLTDEQMSYCVVDVLGLYRAIISEMRKTGDTIATLPLTSTGFVRRALRDRVENNLSYRKLLYEMILTPAQYKLVRRLCKGGDTLASMSKPIGTVLYDGDSFDYKSSYPAQLVEQKYPIGKFREETGVTMDRIQEIENDGEYYITEIVARGVKLKSSIQPIPCISCYTADYISPDAIVYNGRLLQASEIYIAFDMPSFQLFRAQYDFDEIYFGETYSSLYDFLPDVYRDFVLEIFRDKCGLEYKVKEEKHTAEELKDLDQDYVLSKRNLNGIFGMAYTNPLHDEYTYLPDEYSWSDPEIADLDNPETQKKLFNNQKNAVAPYIWGVHTASLGRVALDRLINTVGWYDTWYCDTDSNKCARKPEIRARVAALNEELKTVAESKGARVDINGKSYYLGIVECETENNPILEFRTQGAKKYVYRLKDGLHMTLAGVAKEQVVQLNDDIMNFEPGFVFNPAGGVTMHYLDGSPRVQHVKGDDGTECDIWLASNIVATDRVITLGSIVAGSISQQPSLRKNKERPCLIDELVDMMTLERDEEVSTGD